MLPKILPQKINQKDLNDANDINDLMENCQFLENTKAQISDLCLLPISVASIDIVVDASDVNRNGFILSGVLTKNILFILPSSAYTKQYTIVNNCTCKDDGNFCVIIKTSEVTGKTVNSRIGTATKVYSDGVNIINPDSKVGQLYIGLKNQTPSNVLPLSGSLKSRTIFSGLYEWAIANASFSDTDASWIAGDVGKFSHGDGSTNFRLPDYSGLFMRGAGTNSILKKTNNNLYTGGSVGSVFTDKILDHTHQYASAQYGTSACRYPEQILVAGQAISVASSGVYGMASRTGDEVAPACFAVEFGIYFE